jgi:hypothetical protein
MMRFAQALFKFKDEIFPKAVSAHCIHIRLCAPASAPRADQPAVETNIFPTKSITGNVRQCIV